MARWAIVAPRPGAVKRSVGDLGHLRLVTLITGSWRGGGRRCYRAARPAQLDLVARVGVAVAHRRLGPSSSATTPDRLLGLPLWPVIRPPVAYRLKLVLNLGSR
jgi:hypothetical protein